MHKCTFHTRSSASNFSVHILKLYNYESAQMFPARYTDKSLKSVKLLHFQSEEEEEQGQTRISFIMDGKVSAIIYGG